MNIHRHLAGRATGSTTSAASLFRGAAARVRVFLPAAVGLLCMLGLVVPSGATAPVVPFVTVHQRWDHRWFVWLPRRPVHEAVGVMSIESSGGHHGAVTVFFTEREGAMCQVHYFDDRQTVEHFPGSHFRPIEYDRSGTQGQGHNVRVALTRLDEALDGPLPHYGALDAVCSDNRVCFPHQ